MGFYENLDGIVRWIVGLFFCYLITGIPKEKIMEMQHNVLSESKEVKLAAEINDLEDQRHRYRNTKIVSFLVCSVRKPPGFLIF